MPVSSTVRLPLIVLRAIVLTSLLFACVYALVASSGVDEGDPAWCRYETVLAARLIALLPR
jgi:hypothetical protein